MKFFIRNSVLWCVSLLALMGVTVVPFIVSQNNANASIDGRGEFDPNDKDSDGMSDAWEVHYFGSIEARSGGEDDDLDDVLNVDEWLEGSNPLKLEPKSIGECGSLSVSQPDANTWHTVRLDGRYSKPVVIMGLPSANGGDPMTVRVRNVKANSFEFQFDEYDYLEGAHIQESISWLVVEEGKHVLPGGTVIQAGYNQVESGGGSIVFPEAFASVPVVFSQVTTLNGHYAVSPRQWNVTTSGFDTILRGQESNVTHNYEEKVAWVAMEKGEGENVAGYFEAKETGLSVDHRWKSIWFSQPFDKNPVFFAMMQTKNGEDSATERYRKLSNSSGQVKIQEEQSNDSETEHALENIGWYAASKGMFHVLPTTGDQDADGMADSYELENGLTIGEFDYYGDKDGDGLTNAQEYLYGTRADLADSDGDGISDFDEVKFFESDALARDVGEFQLTQVIPGGQYARHSGEWKSEGVHAVQTSTRGWLEYDLEISNSGVYVVEVDVNSYDQGNGTRIHDFIVSVDDVFVSNEKLEIKTSNTMRIITPWLSQGSHKVKVFVDNSYTSRRVSIERLRLMSSSGTDSNDNGIADWTEIRVQRQNGLAREVTQSKTSPVCIEGKARFLDLVHNDGEAQLIPGPNDTWYTNIDLSSEKNTEINFSFENNGLNQSLDIEWIVTDLMAEDNLTIRQGDSLRLAASLQEGGQASILIEGNEYSIEYEEDIEYCFEKSGNCEILLQANIDGSMVEKTITVDVVPLVNNINSPVCVPGFERLWSVEGLPEKAVVQIDDDVDVYDGEEIEGGYKYSIGMGDVQSKYAVVRLGYSGPIIGSVEIRGMKLRSSDQTGLRYSEYLGDGNHILNMPVVVNGVYSDITIKCDIFLAGVMFLDGSQSKEIQSDEFNEFGSADLKFIKPANAHSNCHRFGVWHNGVRIAYYN